MDVARLGSLAVLSVTWNLSCSLVRGRESGEFVRGQEECVCGSWLWSL